MDAGNERAGGEWGNSEALLRVAIMKKFRKLLNNLLTIRAVLVLGPSLYLLYVSKFLVNIINIIKAGDFRPLDKSMGKVAKYFHYRGHDFIFDCKFCDENLDEDSFGFGIAREIYIRDCYFKWLPPKVYCAARTVVDLGANRGGFSMLMTNRAKFILSVECGKQYVPIIRHNYEANNYSSYAIETAYVGAGGSTASDSPQIKINELFQRYNIDFVDLIKIDIEGAEFSLFDFENSDNWLQRVGAISMEVHPLHGDPNDILTVLSKNNFTYIIADENLQRMKNPKLSSFIYAWRET